MTRLERTDCLTGRPLLTADLEGTRVETLGFEKRVDVPFGNGYHWIEVAPAGAETTIAIVPPPPGRPTGNVETGIGLHTDDIDAYHADLKRAGSMSILRSAAWVTPSRRCSGSAIVTATP